MNGGPDRTGTRLIERHGDPISSHGMVNFVHRHVVELITAVYLTYIILGTLIPFDFSLSAAFRQDRSIIGLGMTASGWPDLLSNIGLYIPLGALLYWSLVRTVGHPWICILCSALAAAVLSLTIESIQLLSPTRVSSVADFTANLLGAAGGAALAWICRGPERRMLDALASELGDEPHLTLTKIYVGLLVLAAAAPFTPTFDVTRLAGSVRSTTLVPFAQTSALTAASAEAIQAGEFDKAIACQRDRMQLWVRWAAEFLSFALLGLLMCRVLHSHYRFKPPTALALSTYLAAMLAVALSLLQIVILSRGFHVTDILMRTAGAVAGYLVLPAALFRSGAARLTSELTVSRLAKPVLLAAAVMVIFSGLLPFRFELDESRASASIASNEFLPFYSYYVGRFDRVCADFWAKSLRFGFLGVAMWACWRDGRAGRSLELRWVVIAGAALATSGFIEVCQLFLRSRVTSLTDIIIAPLAAWIAAVLAQYAADFYRSAVGPPISQQADDQTTAPEWSITDALVGSLIPDQMATANPTSPSEQTQPYRGEDE